MSHTGPAGREEIESEQLRRFNQQLAELSANHFYRTRLPTGPLASLAELRRLPLLTKSELTADQADHPPFGTNLSYPPNGYTRFCQTSGTSGQPIRWLDTEASWAWMVQRWLRILRLAGVTAADRIYFAFSFGPFLGFWTAFDAGVQLGALCIPGGGLSTEGRRTAVVENGATVLCCTPSYALRLSGADLSHSVRLLLLAGEPGGSVPEMRERLKAAWGSSVQIVDHHGMTETGPVTYQCPAAPGRLHVMEEAFIPEVVDPATGEPYLGDELAGQTGELVLTNLGRWGSPLLRYRTGDLVRPARVGCCACGTWEMALEGGILGRVDDMVVVRGVNLYPSAVDAVVFGVPGVAEYRAQIREFRSMTELLLEVEPRPGADGELCVSVETALRRAFPLRIPVRLVEPGTLPRPEMKARRWQRESVESAQ